MNFLVKSKLFLFLPSPLNKLRWQSKTLELGFSGMIQGYRLGRNRSITSQCLLLFR